MLRCRKDLLECLMVARARWISPIFGYAMARMDDTRRRWRSARKRAKTSTAIELGWGGWMSRNVYGAPLKRGLQESLAKKVKKLMEQEIVSSIMLSRASRDRKGHMLVPVLAKAPY